MIERLLQSGTLLRVREQAPERCESPAGLTFADEIHARKQCSQHFTAIALAIHDAFAQLAVQMFELLTNAAEVLDEIVRQYDDLPNALERLEIGEGLRPPLSDSFDLPINPIALCEQLGYSGLRIDVGLISEPCELMNDCGQAALRRRGARLDETRNETDCDGRSRGQLILLLGRAGRKSPDVAGR
jgi:hypothetical protein